VADPSHPTRCTAAGDYFRSLLGHAGEGAAWQFLTTPGEAALRPILDAYDQPVGPKTDPDDLVGPLAHQLRIFLIDGKGEVRNIYSVGFLDPRLVITDVRTLLVETRASPGAT
jgi:cytochrome oxidase Cu insertion factor (SCO1/SenC/PrrC family)